MKELFLDTAFCFERVALLTDEHWSFNKNKRENWKQKFYEKKKKEKQID
jgi:hypothetical protein